MKLDQILTGEALFHPTCNDDPLTLAKLADTRQLPEKVTANLQYIRRRISIGLGYFYSTGLDLDVFANWWLDEEDHDTRPTYTLKEVQDDESNS